MGPHCGSFCSAPYGWQADSRQGHSALPPSSLQQRGKKELFLRALERAQSAKPRNAFQQSLIIITVRITVTLIACETNFCAVLWFISATRCTVYRRKKATEEDKRILGEAGRVRRRQVPAGLPCDLCGQPKRLEFGHVTYRGRSFCSSTSDWLTEQRRNTGANRGRGIPKTTAWHMKRRRQKEQEAEERGITLKERKRPGFHICQLCGQPCQKAYGHSRYKNISFCSAYEGKSVELWLAEQRTADRAGKPVKSRSGRK